MSLKMGAFLLALIFFAGIFAFSSNPCKTSDKLVTTIGIGDTVTIKVTGNKCEITICTDCGSSCTKVFKAETWPPDTLASINYTWPPDTLHKGILTSVNSSKTSE